MIYTHVAKVAWVFLRNEYRQCRKSQQMMKKKFFAKSFITYVFE